jgi:hypothetical protein
MRIRAWVVPRARIVEEGQVAKVKFTGTVVWFILITCVAFALIIVLLLLALGGLMGDTLVAKGCPQGCGLIRTEFSVGTGIRGLVCP